MLASRDVNDVNEQPVVDGVRTASSNVSQLIRNETCDLDKTGEPVANVTVTDILARRHPRNSNETLYCPSDFELQRYTVSRGGPG